MTPLEVAGGISDFIKEKLAEYSDKNEIETRDGTDIASEPYHVYVGFLPYVQTQEERKKLCPAIVVRPLEVNDEKDASKVILGIYVTTYDENMTVGCYGLYHILEFLRFHLLAQNPVANRFMLEPGSLTTSIPDEQPYPQWWGRLDFAVYIEQPSNGKYVAGLNMWRRQRDERDRKKGR